MRDPVLSVQDAVMNETEDIPVSIRFIFKDKTQICGGDKLQGERSQQDREVGGQEEWPRKWTLA